MKNVIGALSLGFIVLAGSVSAQTVSSASDVQSRTRAIAASFTKFKQLSKEKHGVKKEKYLRVESEPAIETTPTEYSGVYRVPDMPFTLRLNVDSKGVVTGSGDEALTESVRRTFTLRNGKVQGALLTATKVYADGTSAPIEGAFMNRSTFESPTDTGRTVFGFGTRISPIEFSGNTYDKLFYERSR